MLSLLLIASLTSIGQGETNSRLIESEAKALVQAVQDELYEYEYQGHFFPEGEPVGDVVSNSDANPGTTRLRRHHHRRPTRTRATGAEMRHLVRKESPC